jgi:hypothetical protein
MGKAYGLIGISAGSAAGAGVGTLTQETAMQLSEGKFDPGSILFKTGKDAAMTFIGSMIGGALGSKFASLLGPRLATVIPNEAVRQFVVARVADVGSSLLTTPIDITVTGMLEGKWPKDMDDLLDTVAANAVRDVIVGGGIDIVTGIPNLKGKAWNDLTAADVGGAKQLGAGESSPFRSLGDEEIGAAVSGLGEAGPMVRGPAGAQTAGSLVNVEVVSRLNNEVAALVQGRGVAEPPTGAALARSDAEVELARIILANPNPPPGAVDQALQVIVERAVADYRALAIHAEPGGTPETALTADELRGACGTGRDVTADSVASLTLGSRTPIVVHRIQAAHLGIPDARHAFTVIVSRDGSYLVDPTFAQFADRIGHAQAEARGEGSSYTAEGMLSDPRAVQVARDLLVEGFVPLTPTNARDYALGLGARPDQADVVAARIMGGDAAVLTEVVRNGRVSRGSTRPGEAYNTMTLPIDPDTPGAGTIRNIDQILARMTPTDPARPGLASLRTRLLLVAAEQQPVTPTGVGRRPGRR